MLRIAHIQSVNDSEASGGKEEEMWMASTPPCDGLFGVLLLGSRTFMFLCGIVHSVLGMCNVRLLSFFFNLAIFVMASRLQLFDLVVLLP